MTAYFNTYYNAKRLFDEAESAVEAWRISNRITDKTVPVQLSSQTTQQFNQVIEKCYKLLQFYPTSKWVDNSLFLIGASYYYLGDDRKAQRQFAELRSTFPKSGFALKSDLWLGMSLYRMQNYTDAAQLLEVLVEAAQEKKKNDIAIEAMFLLGRTFSDQNEYAQSIGIYRRIIESYNDNRARSRAQMRIGQLYAEQDSLQLASDAYDAVLKYDPDENTKFEAELQRSVILTQIGLHEMALETLKRVRREVENTEWYSRIDLEIANTYSAMGLFDEAIDQYTFVDTTYAGTEISAKGYFALGMVYEKKLLDYEKALNSYDKARSEFPEADVTDLASSKWRTFRNYFQLSTTIANIDSILHEFKNTSPTKTTVDSLAIRPDSLGSHSTLLVPPVLDSSVQDQDDSLTLLLGENKASEHANAMYELGNLFLFDISIVDSSEYWYRRVISEYPGSNVAPRALYTLADIYRTSKYENPDTVDLLYRTLIEKYSGTQYAKEARRILGMNVERAIDSAADEYVRGETLLLEGNIETALSVFRSLIQNYPESPIVAKVKYTIGWIFENMKMKADSARDYYRQVMEEYPESVYAEAVKAKLLTVEPPEKEAKSIPVPVDPKPTPEKKATEPEKPAKPDIDQLDEEQPP